MLSHLYHSIKNFTIRFVLLFYYSGREFGRDQCPTRAAALTYFTLLALVPLLVLVFVFFKTFGGDTLIDTQIKPLLFTLLSPGTGQVISGAIDELVQKSRTGTLGSIGFLFLVLTSFSLMDQTHFTLNAIWGERKSRPILQRWTTYWAALTVSPLLVILSISFTAYLGSLQEVQELSQQVVPSLYNLIPIILQGGAFLFLYLFLPTVKVKFLPALAGAFIASFIWEFVKNGYLFYTSNALAYNLIYGSMAVLPLFMIWLFLSWMTMLFGAEFAFAWQNFNMICESRKRMNIPRQWFEALGLEIVLSIAQNFLRGGKSFNSDAFAEEKSIPGDLIKGVVHKLTSTGVLREANGEVILSRDPLELTVQDVIEALRSGKADTPPFAAHDRDIRRAYDFLQNLESPDRMNKNAWSIKRVIENLNVSS